MWWLLAFAILFFVVGSTWWFGLWTNVLNLLNFFLAAMVASSFYENVAYTLEEVNPGFQYLNDFLALWGLFVLSFLILRTATDILSPLRLKFNIVVDYIGRSVVSLWLALSFLAFTFFSLHLAPLPPDSFATSPEERALGIGPDYLWMAFIQSRSRGALSAGRECMIFGDYDLSAHPDDVNLNARVFDPTGNFVFEQAARRWRISNNEVLRTAD